MPELNDEILTQRREAQRLKKKSGKEYRGKKNELKLRS